MFEKRFRLAALFSLLLPLIQALPALAHGDKVIPQVPDGAQADGTSYRTKFDFTNLGPETSTPITKVKVLFFLKNGSPWTIATNLGTASEFTLNLGAFQTLRLETNGSSPQLTTGYVIVRSSEGQTYFAEDYEVAITAYYEVSKGGKVNDTVSVTVGQPTVTWVFPTQIDNAQGLYTGFAIVNLSTKSNAVNLKLYRSVTPLTNPAVNDPGNSTAITLAAGEQRTALLYPELFANTSSFKGMLLGYSDGPVAILALLLTPTSAGTQYATLVPTYADAIRRNTYMYLRQGLPLDLDLPVSDYFGNDQDKAPWDLLYVTNTTDITKRQLQPQQGALFAALGKLDTDPFDNVTIETLRGLNYSANPIDLSNSSASLANTFAFAVKTGLGRYAKIRIADVITRNDDKGQPVYRDLALEIFVYK